MRKNFEAAAEFESGWVSDTTVEQRVAQLVEMYRLFRDHIEDTEELFGPDRRQALWELQRRLGYPV